MNLLFRQIVISPQSMGYLIIVSHRHFNGMIPQDRASFVHNAAADRQAGHCTHLYCTTVQYWSLLPSLTHCTLFVEEDSLPECLLHISAAYSQHRHLWLAQAAVMSFLLKLTYNVIS